MRNLNASNASSMARVQSQRQMRGMGPSKAIEITEDLFKLQRDTMSMKNREKRDIQTMEF